MNIQVHVCNIISNYIPIFLTKNNRHTIWPKSLCEVNLFKGWYHFFLGEFTS